MNRSVLFKCSPGRPAAPGCSLPTLPRNICGYDRSLHLTTVYGTFLPAFPEGCFP